jgi:hypothetical protein
MEPVEPLLLFSHRLELETCVEAIRNRHVTSFRAELVGVGPRDAGRRTAHLLDSSDEKPTVLSLGSAGWLVAGTYPPQPLWAREVKSLSGLSLRPTLSIPPTMLAEYGWHAARLLTVPRPVVDLARARELAEEFGAEAVDMESNAILDACVDRNVSCAVLRVVTDKADANAVARYRERVPGAMQVLGDSVARLLLWLENKRQSGR